MCVHPNRIESNPIPPGRDEAMQMKREEKRDDGKAKRIAREERMRAWGGNGWEGVLLRCSGILRPCSGKVVRRRVCLVDQALVGRCMERNAASRRNKRGASDGEKGRRMDSTTIRARSWMLQNKKCKNVDNTTKIDGKDDRKGRARLARVGGGRKKKQYRETNTLQERARHGQHGSNRGWQNAHRGRGA